MSAPGGYRDRNRTCRVKGCDKPAETVVGCRVRFPSPDDADSRGLASVNVTLVFCRGHAADAIQGIRDREVKVGSRTMDGAGVRRFEQFLETGTTDEGGHDETAA